MHLFMLVTNQHPSGFFLGLSISTIKPGRAHDSTCLIGVGEHRFVTGPSFLDYSKPLQLSTANLTKLVGSGYYPRHDDISAQLLARVCAGIMVSPRVAGWVRQFVAAYP